MENSTEKIVKVVYKSEELGEIEGILHDQFFDRDSIFFNAEEKVVFIKFKRKVYERRRRIKNIFFIKSFEVPLVLSEIKIDNVLSCEISDKSKIGSYSFNQIRCIDSKNLLVFSTNEQLEISIKFSNLRIEIRDLEKIPKPKTILSIFGIEYEKSE